MSDNDELLSGEDVFSGVRSMINFDVLPAVEFLVDHDLDHEQVRLTAGQTLI
jgi:hypothetical protein